MRQQHSPSASAGWRHLFWLALLVGASIAFSLGFACAIPFAAFAAAAALTPRQTRDPSSRCSSSAALVGRAAGQTDDCSCLL
jgi:hypothetical protein